MLSTIQTDEKHKKLEALLEYFNVGEDEDYEDSLKGIFEISESEHEKLKKNLNKIMSPTLNEMCIDEEGMVQEEKEVVDYAQEVSRTAE